MVSEVGGTAFTPRTREGGHREAAEPLLLLVVIGSRVGDPPAEWMG